MNAFGVLAWLFCGVVNAVYLTLPHPTRLHVPLMLLCLSFLGIAVCSYRCGRQAGTRDAHAAHIHAMRGPRF